jgi:hypothetical protein
MDSANTKTVNVTNGIIAATDAITAIGSSIVVIILPLIKAIPVRCDNKNCNDPLRTQETAACYCSRNYRYTMLVFRCKTSKKGISHYLNSEYTTEGYNIHKLLKLLRT